MRITLTELRQATSGLTPLLEIVSIEGQRYLVRVQLSGQTLVLSGEDGRARLFRSSREALDALAAIPFARAEMVHGSAYNQMVGLEGHPVEPLRIPLQGRQA